MTNESPWEKDQWKKWKNETKKNSTHTQQVINKHNERFFLDTHWYGRPLRLRRTRWRHKRCTEITVVAIWSAFLLHGAGAADEWYNIATQLS